MNLINAISYSTSRCFHTTSKYLNKHFSSTTKKKKKSWYLFLSRTICWTTQSSRPDGSCAFVRLLFSSSIEPRSAPIFVAGNIVLSNHIYTIIIYYTRKSADWMFFGDLNLYCISLYCVKIFHRSLVNVMSLECSHGLKDVELINLIPFAVNA